jgi:hypothetical protein
MIDVGPGVGEHGDVQAFRLNAELAVFTRHQPFLRESFRWRK